MTRHRGARRRHVLRDRARRSVPRRPQRPGRPGRARAGAAPDPPHRGRRVHERRRSRPRPADGVPANGTDLLALDGDGQQLWAAGGGGHVRPGRAATAASSRALPDGRVPRRDHAGARCASRSRRVLRHRPLRRHRRGAGHHRPRGRRSSASGRRRQTGAPARVALAATATARRRHDAAGERARARSRREDRVHRPERGLDGDAAGWVFHYTDGTRVPAQHRPGVRGHDRASGPNEAAEQFIPDAPPVDDSELFKPPPVELEQEPPPAQTKRLPALLRQVRTKLRGRRLIVSFTAHAPRARAAAGPAQGPHRRAHEGAHAEARAPPAGAQAGPAALAAAAQLPRARAGRAGSRRQMLRVTTRSRPAATPATRSPPATVAARRR